MAPSDRDLGPQRHSGLGHLHGQMHDLDNLEHAAGGIGPSYDPQGNRIDPMAGFRSIIKETQAAAQTVRQVTQELKLAADAAKAFQSATTRMMNDAAAAMENAAQAQRRLADSFRNGPPGPPRGPRGGRGAGSPDDHGDDGEDGAARGASDGVRSARRRQTEQARRNAQHASDRRATSLHGSKEGEDLHERNTRSGLRRMVAEGIHQVGGRGNRLNSTLRPRYDPNGNLSHYDLMHPNGTTERIETTSRRVPGLLARHARQGVVSGVGRALSSGGIGTAARAVPVLGTAIAVGEGFNDAAEWATNQQKKNTVYQSIYGGDKALTGISNRLEEEGYVLGNRFGDWNGMTSEDSREAFQGVSQLGYQGAQRTDALNFIEKTYGDLGVDVNTSLKLVQASASHANTSLTGLSTALNGVQQMAVATGQSANVLYGAFANNYQLALQMGAGTGSAALAAGLTGSTAGANRDFANIDTSRAGSDYGNYRLAQFGGMSYGNLLAQARQGHPEVLAGALDKWNDTAAQGATMSDPRVAQTIQAAIAKAGGAGNITPGSESDIATQVLAIPGVNVNNLKAYYQAMSGEDVSNLSVDQVVERLVDRTVHPNSAADQVKKNEEQFGQKDLLSTDPKATPGTSSFVTENTSGPFDIAGWFPWTATSQKNDVVSAYNQLQTKTNKTDPVIEDLIKTVGSDSNVGIQVQTGNGQKVVSQSDAIKYYADQVAKGTATVIGGQYNGQTVKGVVGGSEDNFQGVGGVSSDTTGDKTDHGGVDANKWLSDHGGAGTNGNVSGTVTISMTPQMANFFQISTTGSAKYDSAASNGVPPTPSGAVPQ